MPRFVRMAWLPDSQHLISVDYEGSLYRWDVKGGRRELSIGKGAKRKGGSKALHLSVNKLDGRLYKVEASEPLENGEYSLSPNDSNKVFCFEVY